MAIVGTPKQIGAGRSGDLKKDYNRTYEVHYRVIVDNRYDGTATVGSYFDDVLFTPYEGYENIADSDALCTGIKPSQDGDDWQRWIVTLTFETNFTEGQQNQDPSQDPVVPWVEVEVENRKVVKEYDGTFIRNSAGQLLDGLERKFRIVKLCFLRNELSNTSFLLDYNDCTNEGEYKGMDEGTALLEILIDKPQVRKGLIYFPHTYKFAYKKDGWNVDPIDMGTAVKNAAGKLVLARDELNNPLDGDFPLDGSGARLAPGGTLKKLSECAGLAQSGRKTKLYEPKNFSTLGL